MTAKQAKFQLEFMLLMTNVGRFEEANEACKKLHEYLAAKAKEEELK